MVRAVAAGGIIGFNCGPGPVTIVMANTAKVIKTRHLVVLDGGGRITLSGGGKRRILYADTCAGTWSTNDCVNQPYPQIVVQNITFEDGYDGAHEATCTANVPRCWYGGVDGGGAIYVEGGQFKAANSSFVDNHCYAYGPDWAVAPSAHWRSTRTARYTSRATRSAAAAARTAGRSAASACSGTF